VRELEPFIVWARGHASDCGYGTPGIGTLPHLLGATLFRESRVDAQHVVYSGGLTAVSDMLAGRLAAVVLPEGLLRAYHDAGRLRIVATSGERRSRFTLGAPTLAEQGHPTVFTHEWFGFFMPRAVPPVIVEQTSESIQVAAGTPRVLQALDELAIEASVTRPAAMAQRIAAERRHWEHQIVQLGLRLE
jgi:tripartite-type tricarboxylate transporter receptor subunit TctC